MRSTEKTVTAIPENEVAVLLEHFDLLDDYQSGGLVCASCHRPLVSAGLGCVRMQEGRLVFSCAALECMAACST